MTEFSKKELQNSKRIFKSATPKYTLDWYVKWIASVILIAAMFARGFEELKAYDLIFSFLGCAGWLWVSLIWKDRALIILNSVAMLILGQGILRYFLI